MALLFAFVLGMAGGMRSTTPVAVVAWAAQLGWPALRQTGLSFMAAPITAYASTIFACLELVFDKLPIAPSRLEAAPLGARIVVGGLCGATLMAAAQQPVVAGAIAGGIGGLTGACAGYWTRRYLTVNRGAPDFLVALVEDAIAIGSAVFAVSRI